MKLTKAELKQLIKEELEETYSAVDRINTAAREEGRINDKLMEIFRSLYNEGRDVGEVLDLMQEVSRISQEDFNTFMTFANEYYR